MKMFSPVGWIKFLARGVFALLLIAGWAIAALAVHVVVVPVEVDDGGESWKVVVVPKERLGIDDTYVDTRAWDAEQAREHAALLARMAEAGKGDLVGELLADTTVREAVDALMRAGLDQ